MKKKVKSCWGEAFGFVVASLFFFSSYRATLVDDVKVQRVWLRT